MAKRTLVFTTAGDLRLRNNQLAWEGHGTDGTAGTTALVPVEDVGLVVLESPRIGLTTAVLAALAAEGAAVVLCDGTYMPTTYVLPGAGHSLAHRHLREQVRLGDIRRKALWKQVVQAKIRNQAAAVAVLSASVAKALRGWSRAVRSGDAANLEAQAARSYFSAFARKWPGFERRREGGMPNPALNYGYALLRGTMARAIVSAGLHPSIGLFHDRQDNDFCLADDLMEPYRPLVDEAVMANADVWGTGAAETPERLGREQKRILLEVLAGRVAIGAEACPLPMAMARTATSMVRALTDEKATLALPDLA